MTLKKSTLFKIFLFLNLGTHQEKKTANLKSEKIYKKQEKNDISTVVI